MKNPLWRNGKRRVNQQVQNYKGWFYKLALFDFELIFEVKMQESEGV